MGLFSLPNLIRKGILYASKNHSLRTRLTALLLALVCVLGLLPSTAFAATQDTIKMDDCAYSGTKYESPALGECYMHQMHFWPQRKKYDGLLR